MLAKLRRRRIWLCAASCAVLSLLALSACADIPYVSGQPSQSATPTGVLPTKAPPLKTPATTPTRTPRVTAATPAFTPVYTMRCGVPANKTAITYDDSFYGQRTQDVIPLAEHAKSRGVGLYVFQLREQVDRYYDKTGIDIYQELRDLGMYLGNHTYGHKSLISPKTHAEWEITHGAESGWLRPPGGASNLQIRNLAYKHGFDVCTWTFDTFDWKAVNGKTPTGAQICTNVVANAPKGAVILMHLNHNAANNKTLDCMIDGLRAKGHNLCRPYTATHPGVATPVRLYKLPC